MNLEAYFNSKESYLKKEEVLFTVMDELDRESYRIYKEVTNLSNVSFYKVTSLKENIAKLKNLYQIVLVNYEKILLIELSSYSYASKRWAFKWLISSALVINIILKYALLTISSYIAINYIIGKDYIEEYKSIDERMLNFDEQKLVGIGITLDNCERIILVKEQQMVNSINSNAQELPKSMLANDIIAAYLLGVNSKLEPDKLPDHIKKAIRTILKEDLRTDNDNIKELLEEAKNSETKTLKLIKKYES